VSTFIHGVDASIVVYFIALNSFYALLLILALPEIWDQHRLAEDEDLLRLQEVGAPPPISILVPAYNESATIEASVTAILTLDYRHYEVIVVNDGSKDDTMGRMEEAFDLYEVPRTYPEVLPSKPIRALYRSRTRPRLMVIDKENGGKADSLNAAINASRWPLVIAVDADTLIEPDAMLRLTRPFSLGMRVAAVGGTVRVANGSVIKDGRVLEPRVAPRFIPGVQVVEYLRSFLYGRLGWNRLGGNLIISGAFGLFRKDYLLEIGGYRTDSIVEDFDVVVRLHRYLLDRRAPYLITFVPDPVAWTEVPESMAVLSRQRERWHRGLIFTMWKYRHMLFRPRYKRIGFLGVPFFTFGEMLAPLVELMGYVVTGMGLWLGFVNLPFAILFLLVALGYGMILSIWGIMLEEIGFRRYRRWSDLGRLLLYAVLENFGYRQCTVWYRLRAFWSAMRARHTWGRMTRTGFAAAGTKVSP
jgi:cellulose synthase/poly-beta-1,6-N-acetylglucosamine synthase-like glycosyltransferase